MIDVLMGIEFFTRTHNPEGYPLRRWHGEAECGGDYSEVVEFRRITSAAQGKKRRRTGAGDHDHS